MSITKTTIRGALAALMLSPIALVGEACATTRMAGEQSDDARITGRVGRSLVADPEVRRYQIDVDTLDRVVTLRGIVESEEISRAAEEIARTTDGVERVVNQLKIESHEESEQKKEANDEQPADIVIRTKVGTSLTADPQIRRFNIDVDVQDGVVALSGVVHDEVARLEAEKLARNVEGVREVRNELTVNEDDQLLSEDDSDPKKTGSDESEAEDAEERRDEPSDRKNQDKDTTER